jgi:hypothetical protein
MTLFRWQRSSLQDSMTTVTQFAGLTALTDVIKSRVPMSDADKVTIEHYGFDCRINWETHIVLVNGEPVGFTDGPVAP